MKIPKNNITGIISDSIKKIPSLFLKKDRSPHDINNIILREMRTDNNIPSYAIIKMNNKYIEQYQVVGEALSSTYGNNKFEKMQNIGALLLKLDPNESETLIKKFNSNKNVFSSKIKKALSYTDVSYQSGISYTPETFQKYLDLILKRRPEKSKSKWRGLKDIIVKDFWHHNALNVYAAWERTQGECEYKVAVIDTGCEYTHKEIRNAFDRSPGYNYVDDNNDPMDRNGHGTHVAGSIAGREVGIAPKAKLVALKVLNDEGVGSTADVMKAVDYCGTKTNIKVLNLSLGGSYDNPIERMLYKEVANRGKLIFAAAGNSGIIQEEFPAAYDGVISTAATDEENKHARFSTLNDKVKSSCPGVNIYSSFLDDGYEFLNGTSMATPQNAGVGILAVSINPDIEYESYLGLLENTCLELGKGKEHQKEMYGFGLTQADRIASILKFGEGRIRRRGSLSERYKSRD